MRELAYMLTLSGLGALVRQPRGRGGVSGHSCPGMLCFPLPAPVCPSLSWMMLFADLPSHFNKSLPQKQVSLLLFYYPTTPTTELLTTRKFFFFQKEEVTVDVTTTMYQNNKSRGAC